MEKIYTGGDNILKVEKEVRELVTYIIGGVIFIIVIRFIWKKFNK